MINIVCDLVIDFETTNPESDVRLARRVMIEFEKHFLPLIKKLESALT